MKKSIFFFLTILACGISSTQPVEACDCTECLEGKTCPCGSSSESVE